MPLTLQSWLDQLDTTLTDSYSAFDCHVFEGTPAEIVPRLQAWRRPEGVSIEQVDLATVAEEASTIREARERIERELSRVAAIAAPILVLLTGLNLAAAIFQQGLLQPILARLRKGGRFVVLVAPPLIAPADLPESCRLRDWRSELRAAVAGGGREKLISGGT